MSKFVTYFKNLNKIEKNNNVDYTRKKNNTCGRCLHIIKTNQYIG